MTNLSQPDVPPYARQIFLCANGNCAAPAEVHALVRHFQTLNTRHGTGRLSNPHRLILVTCNCLGVCHSGPILVVYPDGIWYGQVDVSKLERIFTEHLLEGQPVEDLIFHRHFPAGEEPAYAPDLRQTNAIDPLQLAAEQAAAEKTAERQAAANQPLPPHVQAARARRRQRLPKNKRGDA